MENDSSKILFYLLGKIDDANPSAIPLDLIKKWEKTSNIKYIGESQDVREYIKEASCIVLPSYREGIPRVLLESSSMQRPIITTYVPGCKEVVAKPIKNKDIYIGKNGILCEVKNPTSLKNAIKHFLNLTQEEILNMGVEGRKYIQERFKISKTITTYLEKVKNIKEGKICFVSNTAFGMYNFRIDVLRSLKNKGYEIHIISPFDKNVDKLTQEGFYHHHIDMISKSLNPIKDIKTFFQIRRILNLLKPTMVFNYTIKPVIYSSLVCNFLKIPNIGVVTGLGYVFLEGGIKKKCLKFLVSKMYQFSLKKTREVWFLNPDDKFEFLKNINIDSNKIFLLDSEGVDTDYFSPQTKVNKNIIFLLISRMLYDKGIAEFVEVAKEFKN